MPPNIGGGGGMPPENIGTGGIEPAEMCHQMIINLHFRFSRVLYQTSL